MHSSTQYIFQKITGKSSLGDGNLNALQQLAEEHPFYGAIHFLLAKKLLVENNADYKTHAYKAALHFFNPLWLNYQLNGEDEIDVLEEESLQQISTTEGVVQDDRTIAQSSETIITNDKDVDYEEEREDVEIKSESNEKLSALLKEQAADFEKPLENEATLPIENIPYHRIDYFDSQGIKLENGKNENDKLEKQLRRFTDWLKQMKKVNPNPSDLGTNQQEEKQVQNLAEHSNEKEEIYTEAMAEVLAKQGKPEQAISVYEKLSFLNPSKSAYFAAKIRELKV